jgi:hypothetical protein
MDALDRRGQWRCVGPAARGAIGCQDEKTPDPLSAAQQAVRDRIPDGGRQKLAVRLIRRRQGRVDRRAVLSGRPLTAVSHPDR